MGTHPFCPKCLPSQEPRGTENRFGCEPKPLYLSCQNGDDPVPVEHRCSQIYFDVDCHNCQINFIIDCHNYQISFTLNIFVSLKSK